MRAIRAIAAICFAPSVFVRESSQTFWIVPKADKVGQPNFGGTRPKLSGSCQKRTKSANPILGGLVPSFLDRAKSGQSRPTEYWRSSQTFWIVPKADKGGQIKLCHELDLPAIGGRPTNRLVQRQVKELGYCGSRVFGTMALAKEGGPCRRSILYAFRMRNRRR